MHGVPPLLVWRDSTAGRGADLMNDSVFRPPLALAWDLDVADDPCPQRLELRIADKSGVEHRLGVAQPRGGISRRTLASTGTARRGEAAQLDATGARTQLLEVAYPAFFAPGLVVRLADPVERLRFVLAQASEYQIAGGRGAGAEVCLVQDREVQRGGEDPDLDVHFLQVLPAHVGQREAAEQPSGDREEATARGANRNAPMSQCKKPMLDCPGFELFVGRKH